jgi:hypothetical protein
VTDGTAGLLGVGVADHGDGCGQALPVQGSDLRAGQLSCRLSVRLRRTGGDHGLLQLRAGGGISQDEQPGNDATGQAGADDEG